MRKAEEPARALSTSQRRASSDQGPGRRVSALIADGPSLRKLRSEASVPRALDVFRLRPFFAWQVTGGHGGLQAPWRHAPNCAAAEIPAPAPKDSQPLLSGFGEECRSSRRIGMTKLSCAVHLRTNLTASQTPPHRSARSARACAPHPRRPPRRFLESVPPLPGTCADRGEESPSRASPTSERLSAGARGPGLLQVAGLREQREKARAESSEGSIACAELARSCARPAEALGRAAGRSRQGGGRGIQKHQAVDL